MMMAVGAERARVSCSRIAASFRGASRRSPNWTVLMSVPLARTGIHAASNTRWPLSLCASARRS